MAQAAEADADVAANLGTVLCMYMYLCTCMYFLDAHLCIYVTLFVYEKRLYVYIFMCVCMYVCMYVCMCTHIHTDAHTYNHNHKYSYTIIHTIQTYSYIYKHIYTYCSALTLINYLLTYIHTYIAVDSVGESKSSGDVGSIFKSQVLSSVIRMRPIKDIRDMSVVWQLPSTDHYNSPTDLISYVLGEMSTVFLK